MSVVIDIDLLTRPLGKLTSNLALVPSLSLNCVQGPLWCKYFIMWWWYVTCEDAAHTQFPSPTVFFMGSFLLVTRAAPASSYICSSWWQGRIREPHTWNRISSSSPLLPPIATGSSKQDVALKHFPLPDAPRLISVRSRVGRIKKLTFSRGEEMVQKKKKSEERPWNNKWEREKCWDRESKNEEHW